MFFMKPITKLKGFAVLFTNRIEYWQYDPAVLTKAQRKKLGITGWKSFTVGVKAGNHG